MVHGIAVDPKNGNVWLGDREEYRLVVYTGDGKFVKTVQMRNLMCAVAFDPHGNLWVASGQDGQLLKSTRTATYSARWVTDRAWATASSSKPTTWPGISKATYIPATPALGGSRRWSRRRRSHKRQMNLPGAKGSKLT